MGEFQRTQVIPISIHALTWRVTPMTVHFWFSQ